ncbi:MAG TPA: DUF1501 domain-containing protein [Pirellulales bacterium]|nr:DUF1501 domain-containing protein [Pirellulales bacterium]
MRHPPVSHDLLQNVIRRRTFLVAGGLTFCGLDLPGLVGAAEQAPRGKATSTIMIWLSGGVSHLDTWDLKPEAPAEYRGEFKPIETSAPGVRMCEHLSLTARQAHHLAVVNSLGHYGRGTGDHHAGYYYNLTGHEPDQSFRTLGNNRTPQPDDWPFLGTVVGLKSPPHPYLPPVISLPQKPGAPMYTRPGQFAARLGVEYDPLYVEGSLERPLEFTVPALRLEGSVDPARLRSRRGLLGAVDSATRSAEADGQLVTYTKQQQRAFTLLSSQATRDAFDLSQEPASLRERYGATVNASSMLLARRLVEAGVPFVSVFWQENLKTSDAKHCASGGGWDTHGNNFGCLREWLLPEFDQCFSALLDDLHQRSLLERTLVLVTSEMGRQPKIGDPRSGGPRGAGRDHWTHAMSVLFAGGGIRGGQVYGSTDRRGEFPADHPVAPDDIAKTIYHAMGIDDLEVIDREGRPLHLLPTGAPILGLF